MTKQQINYDNSSAFTLWDAYGSFSRDKQLAYDNCLEQMRKDGGFSFRICSVSNWVFTCAYKFKKDGETYLKYFTAKNTYIIKYEY